MSKNDGGPPSYEESTFDSSYDTTRIPRGLQLIDRLTVARSQHIKLVIEQHVCPIVEEHARIGISKTVLVLLPSDVQIPQVDENLYDASNDISKVELMGFSTDEDVQQTRLEGPMNKTSFWRQTGVIDDFRKSLQDRLSTLTELQPIAPPPPAPEPIPAPPARKKGFLARYTSSMSSANDIPTTSSFAPASSSVGSTERVRVEVRLEEICLRTVSAFGLYETINRQGIIIKVNANI